MIPEIGQYALILALMVALVQGTLPLAGAQRGDADWMALARPASIAQFLCVATAFCCLTYAYVTSDFSVLNVAQNSHTAKPMLYKVSGVWGNHEGSLLLWALILAVYGLAVSVFGTNLPASLRARVLAVQALISVGFLAFTVFTSNPFERLDPARLNGSDLNPLLQDPGLAFHPPFLYLGYVGFSMAFSFAIAALLEGRVDAAWARWVRPWTLTAWCFLTIGIAMGSWWAYYELGWGGFWFWDPVENASFMPWLAGTALLHSAIVCEKRDALKSWTILLAIVTFSLSLLGTFLVRSGVLTSVHAFATDPTRGVFILGFLVFVVGGSLVLYAVRAPGMKTGGLFSPISREGSLVVNNLLLSTACATVFLGTMYPLFLDALGGDKVSVGPPYFTGTFAPLMTPLLILTTVGPLMSWKRADLPGALARLKWALAAALAVAVLTWSLTSGSSPLPAFGIGLAGWLIAGAVTGLAERLKLFRAPLADSWKRAVHLPRSAYGMTIAHAGVGVVLAGIVASQSWQSESIQLMRPGDVVTVAGYDFKLLGVGHEMGPNYDTQRAEILVTEDGEQVARLFPEKRHFPVQDMPTTEAAIHTTWFADLYAVIGDENPHETAGSSWNTRIYHNPLVPWIWLGGIVIMIGGAISLSDRRHRVGAPTRARRLGTTAAGAA